MPREPDSVASHSEGGRLLLPKLSRRINQIERRVSVFYLLHNGRGGTELREGGRSQRHCESGSQLMLKYTRGLKLTALDALYEDRASPEGTLRETECKP